MESSQYDPPEELTIKFCLTCERDDLRSEMRERHFRSRDTELISLCRNSQIVTVTYGRKEIRNAHEEK